MEFTQIFTLIVSLIFVLILLILVYFINQKSIIPIKAGLTLEERKQVEENWEKIRQLIRLGGPSRFRAAVIDADKTFMFVLGKLGYHGPSAEKLKRAKWRFKNSYNDVWQAHIIRNRVAHDIDYQLHSSEAKLAISKFEKGLKELGVL